MIKLHHESSNAFMGEFVSYKNIRCEQRGTFLYIINGKKKKTNTNQTAIDKTR